MKTAVYTLLLLMALCCGCDSSHTPCSPLLRQAERWAEVCPDSALACLDSLDVSFHDLPEEARMYSRLLRIKAEDKLYIPHTSDSLINLIVRFYERRGDPRRLAEALYYQGGVYRDCNLPARAIRSYCRAAEVGCNHDTLNGRIYGELAARYAYQKAYDASLEALRRALVYNIRCKNDKGVAYCWRDMARVFDRKDNQSDSAEVYYRKAYTLMQEKGFVRPAYGVLSEWADFSYEQGLYDRAKAFADRILDDHFDELAALVLAKYYWQENRLDSALYYSQAALSGIDIYHHRTAYGILKEIALSQGRTEDARRYAECYQTAFDSISRMTRTEAVVRISQEAEMHDLFSRLKWQRYVLAFVLLALGAGAVVYTLRHIRASRKLKQACEEELVSTEEQELTPPDISLTLEERLGAFRQSAIYLYFCRATQSREVDGAHWRQLVDALNEVYPTFISRLYSLNPKLTELEFHTCCLVKIGISTSRIAMLIDHSPSAVNSILTRLYRKMTGQNTGVSAVKEFIEHLE